MNWVLSIALSRACFTEFPLASSAFCCGSSDFA